MMFKIRIRTAALMVAAAVVVIDVSAPRASIHAAPQDPCDAICTLIRKVVAEEPSGFAALKGQELFGVKRQDDRYQWAGTLKPLQSPFDSCTLSNANHSGGTGSHYECSLHAGSPASGSRFLTPEDAPAAYARVVEELRAALESGWVFASSDSGDGSSGRTMATTAKQTGTKAQVVVKLRVFKGTDAPVPTLSMVFT